MIAEHLFPTLLYIKDLPNAVELNHYLEQQVIKWSQQDKGVAKTNAGGWHSETDMNKKEEYNVLTQELFKMQEEIFTKERLSDKSVLGNMWRILIIQEILIDLIFIRMLYSQASTTLRPLTDPEI